MVSGLPDLFFDDQKTDFSSVAFRDYLKNELTPDDVALTEHLFFPYDNINLLHFVFKQNKIFNPSGNYSRNFMEGLEDSVKQLPQYMTDFLYWIKETGQKEKSLQAETKLQTLFYENCMFIKNDFLREWFFFELNLKNIITIINCTDYNLDPSQHLIQISRNSNLNSILLKSHSKPESYEDDVPFAHQIIRIWKSEYSMVEKEKSIDKIKWQYLDECTFFHYFTIEKILSFVIKLMIIERWMKLDKKTGQELLHRFITELSASYKFPAEYQQQRGFKTIENKTENLNLNNNKVTSNT